MTADAGTSKLLTSLAACADAGSGNVAVAGPPGSGKTYSVIQFLTNDRQRTANRRGGRLKVIYTSLKAMQLYEGGGSAESLMNVVCQHALHHLLGGQNASRRGMDGSFLTFGTAVHHFLNFVPNHSELHFVFDDADVEGVTPDLLGHFFKACIPLHSVDSSKTVLFWFLSLRPMNIPECLRFVFLPKPQPDTVLHWIESSPPNVVCKRPRDEADASVAAVRYYLTRRPMSASIVTTDFRALLKSVVRIGPLLDDLAAAKDAQRSKKAPLDAVGACPLNDLDFSKAWSTLATEGPKVIASQTATREGDALMTGISKLGVSSMILAIAAFYCGVVSAGKDVQVFGGTASSLGGGRQGTSSAVLTSTTYTVTMKRLGSVYEKMTEVCVEMDTCEIIPKEVCVGHYVRSFVEWGMLTPIFNKTDVFHVNIPLPVALSLSREVGIRLYDLIPNK